MICASTSFNSFLVNSVSIYLICSGNRITSYNVCYTKLLRTTAIRQSNNCSLPYRIDLAGTWIDQPYVSKYHPGWALTVSLEPVIEYMERCGMSTSTRNAAKKIWPYYLPLEKPEKLSEMLFKFENTPGSELISGAQDAISYNFV